MAFRRCSGFLLAVILLCAILVAPALWPSDLDSDLASSILAVPPAYADGPGDWPMFHHDPTHTGYSPDESGLKPPLRVRWSQSIGYFGSSAAVADGVVYFGAANGRVYALDTSTGASRWSFPSGGAVMSTPAIDNGVLYFTSLDKSAYALNAADGKLRWSYAAGRSLDSSPVVVSGTVYVFSWDGNLYALDVATKEPKWTYATGVSSSVSAGMVGGSFYSSPAATSDTVYFSDMAGKVRALNASDGALIWARDMGSGVEISSPTVSNGVVFVGSRNSKVYALDAGTGAEKWVFSTGGRVDSTPAVAGGLVYVGSWDKKIYALEAGTGAERWSRALLGEVYASPVVANGIVYVGSRGGDLNALDAATGAVRWSYSVGWMDSSPAVVGGVVYQVVAGGSPSYEACNCTIYAFEGEPPPVAAALPAYQTAGASFPITWTVPITWTGTPAVSYDIQYREGAAVAWTDILTNTVVTTTSFTGQDGHTYSFRVRSRTAAGSLGVWSDTASTTVDLTPPTGSLTVEGWSSPYISNTVTLLPSASDSTSGVAQMQFSSDGADFGPWQAYATTATLVLGPGTTAVYARFQDGAGNVSQPVSASVALDSTPPGGSITARGWSSNYLSATVTLTITGTDSLSGLSQMQVGSDGPSYESWEAFATSRSYTAPPGTTAVYLKLKDNAGNISQPVSATVALDNVPPTGSMTALGWGSNYVSATVTLRITGTDSLSGLSQMQLGADGSTYGSWEAYAASRSYTVPAVTLAVYAKLKDNAGNVSQPVSATLTLDTRPPTGSLALGGGATYTSNRQVSAGLSASDDLSGVSQMAFSIDGSTYGEWQGYSAGWSVTLPSGDGERTVYARFKDRAGNTSEPVSDSIILDTTPPTTPSPDDGLTGVIPGPVVRLQWSPSTDTLSGMERYYYKTDCGSETATSGLSTTSQVLPDGTHAFLVRARDQIGNYSPYGKHAFSIRATSLSAPDLYAPDSPTDRDKINISGVGPATSRIRLYLNCAVYGETMSGNFGAWQFRDVPLVSGENIFAASIADSGGGLSPISLPAAVVRLSSVSGSLPKTAAGLLSSSGGTVSAGQYSVQVPAGALPGEAQVVVTPFGPDSAPPRSGQRSAESFASISALDRSSGAPVQPEQAVRVSLAYDPALLAGISPGQFSVYYHDPDSSAWVALPSQADTANLVITAETTHLSTFGLLAETPSLPVKLYAPVLTRGASGW